MLKVPSPELERSLKIKERLESSMTLKKTLLILVLAGTSMVIVDAFVAPVISDEIVIISVSCLVVLFNVHKYGTSKMGLIVGPAFFIWFGSLTDDQKLANRHLDCEQGCNDVANDLSELSEDEKEKGEHAKDNRPFFKLYLNNNPYNIKGHLKKDYWYNKKNPEKSFGASTFQGSVASTSDDGEILYNEAAIGSKGKRQLTNVWIMDSGATWCNVPDF
ncbi:hypothetical protein RJT34_02026 [Clitoria ternatea]|uniref:Uncharacterized protein n=1 Tax=Clitoria ternatea TaxID=43366 RepID=A0AAN9Q1H5_CLITE